MPRKNMSKEKRQEILKAFGTCLHKQDYRGVSVRDIAKAANIPLGSFHYYFESKDELLITYYKEVLDGYYAEYMKWEKTVPEDMSTFAEFFKSFSEFALQYYDYENSLNSSAVYVHYYSLILRTPLLRDLVVRENRRHAEFIAGIIRKTKIVCEDPLTVAFSLLATLDGFSIFCEAACEGFTREQLLTCLYSMISKQN